jgi:hypothetical protein
MFYETVVESFQKGDFRCEIQTLNRIYKVNFYNRNQFTHAVSVFSINEAREIAEAFIGKTTPILLTE